MADGEARPSPLRYWPYLAHVPVVAWLFAGALFQGQAFYFRDVAVYYYPNYVFLERSLGQGVWPLWNPTSDAGAPFLVADPADLTLVGLFGAEAALRVGPPLHLLLAMAGASWLAGILGLGRLGVWAAGLFYGLSGYVLSTVNLFELFHATAWAPWIVGATLRLLEAPTPRRAAALALLGATQVATLGAETVLQTAVVSLALVLVRGRPSRGALLSLAGAAVLAAGLAAPALLGARALIGGSTRAEGLPLAQSFAYSLRPVALADAVLPRFFGDVHTLSDVGFWGQPFFPEGFPYLLSLYVGPGLVWLALRSSRERQGTALVGLCAIGVLLALGRHGPLEWALVPLMRHFRTPPKFLFTANLALCLLAARGLASGSARRSRSDGVAAALGLVLLGLYPILAARPDLPGRLLGGVLPEILDARARYVIATAWPLAFGAAGALLLGAVLAVRSPATAPLAGVLLGFDLLLANGAVNLTAGPAFYALRPPVQALVEAAAAEGTYRWFAYGAAQTKGLRWAPEVARRNSDVWLYYLERQVLAPRTHVLDGVEGAFDEDRVGWTPRGASIDALERVPSLYRQHHPRLRLANVRFVVSLRPLPDDLVSLRGEAALPEVEEPLRLYELRDPLPRAFRPRGYEVVADPASREARLAAPNFDPRAVALLESTPAGPGVELMGTGESAPAGDAQPGAPDAAGADEGAVGYERLDPHTVRLHVPGRAGLVLVAEGHHADFRAEAGGEARSVLRADGRYWAIPTRGGGEVLTVRYEPAWRAWALAASALGAVAAAYLGLGARGFPLGGSA